jgi:hypothetical protein
MARSQAAAPVRQVTVELADLVCSDPELLDGEFEAIIAAERSHPSGFSTHVHQQTVNSRRSGPDARRPGAGPAPRSGRQRRPRMTADQDLYLVLGVDPSAPARQITHAYRALMRRHHPDTRSRPRPDTRPEPNQDHDAVLQQIAAAYAVLRDPRRRADYDARRALHQQDPVSHRASEPTRRAPDHTGPPVLLGEVAGSRPPRPPWIFVS